MTETDIRKCGCCENFKPDSGSSRGICEADLSAPECLTRFLPGIGEKILRSVDFNFGGQCATFVARPR